MAKRVARSKSSFEPYTPSRNDAVTIVMCRLCGEYGYLADMVHAIIQIASGDIAAPVHGRCLHDWYLLKTQLPQVLAIQTPLL